ncbi:MAG: RagB/SusD family nutrient uptake outer membrane protein [Alistipes sp.]|nr:RagB/SusD family nutrient uptake outer membrane protein [Alistipes sp.]MBQ8471540.1 RagB/SusD family nutrient uptake outer membrane protein [Alistipes sp.]
MKTIKNILLACAVLATGAFSTSCSLEEENPGGFTLESLSTSVEGYQALLNQCYFGMQRFMYLTDGWMELTDADSDIWTYRGNMDTSYTQYFWFFGGAAPNTTYINGLWNSMYDGIGSCNLAIATVNNPPFASENVRREKLAEARFLRAVYYFNAVEQFGGVVKLTAPQTSADYAPVRTEPMEIYRDIILPDLEYAVENLPVGDATYLATPTKKAALGMLAKAYLQTYYYGSTEYVDDALQTAQLLIEDCEAGGGTYGAYMYPNLADVFAEENNLANKESLWKYNLYADNSGYGSSNGNYKLNRYNEKFLCCLSKFGGRVDNQESRLTWEGSQEGLFMPTQHLLNLFVQEDGTLDPRFHQWFSTQWNANTDYTWSADAAANFKKAASVTGTNLVKGDLAVKFVMPQDADYAAEIATKATSPYLLVDYKDVYNDTQKKVIDSNSDGTENLMHYFYPSLNKHNSSNFFVANANKKRNGNLNAAFIIRMAEVYLIAAEADIVANGGGNAMKYINKVRARAGAKILSGTATIRTVLDERARELCGEGTRFYDLKRTGMFKDASYLQSTHPDLAKYFKPEYALRPISTTYLNTLSNGTDPLMQNPGY